MNLWSEIKNILLNENYFYLCRKFSDTNMPLHKFIFTHFGRQMDFQNFLKVTAPTAQRLRDNPERLTYAQIVRLARHAQITECEMVKIIGEGDE
jgi:hypothetical protein